MGLQHGGRTLTPYFQLAGWRWKPGGSAVSLSDVILARNIAGAN
jgi:hypothetical protein